MKAWFVSDIHIKELNERNSHRLLRFLHLIETGTLECTDLFLLGDIFDFWVGDHDHYERKFGPFVELLEKVLHKGIQVRYVEGNHDVHVKKFWQGLGVEAFVEDRYFDLGPHRVRVTHGDLMNPQDETYLKYREFIRQGYMEIVADVLPARAFEWVGKQASLRSRKRSLHQRVINEEDLRSKIRSYAQKVYIEAPFDLLVSGHMHVLDDWTFTVGTQKARSVNLGSWLVSPKVFWLTDKDSGWESVDILNSKLKS